MFYHATVREGRIRVLGGGREVDTCADLLEEEKERGEPLT